MRPSALKIIILLTCLVGISDAAWAQIDTSARARRAAEDTFAIPDPVAAKPGDPKKKKSILDYDIVYDALDSIPSSPDNSIIELYNQGVIEYGSMKIEAGYIRIEFEKAEIYASGLPDSTGKMTQKPIFVEAGKTYRADEMRYNFETGKARINKVITQEGEGFLHGEKVKKTGGAAFFVKNAAYTTCSHEHPHFRIRTPKAKVIPGEKVVTQFAFLELFDIPTPLMLPFGFFPTTDKRKSGIIIPTYGSSQYRGYFLKNGGFYWAASDYLDLSVTGDVYTKGGFGLQGQSNYKVRYNFNGNFNVRYNLLKYGREEFESVVPGAYDNRSDFSVTWSHRQDAKANPYYNFSANVNIATTQFYQITSINPDQVLQNRLNSSVSFSRRWAGKPYSLNVTLNHSQNNQTKDMTLTLPQVNFSVNRMFPFKSEGGIVGKKKWYEEIGITYTANAKNQIQTRMDKPLFTETVFRDSSRMGMQHSIPISANYKVFKFFVFNPSINFTERWYPNKLEYAFDPELNRVVVRDTLNGFFANRDFNANANLSTKLYGLWRYRGFLRAIRHVMTPTVGLSYRPDFSTPFWGYYQEIQSDTLGNTTLVNPYSRGVYGSAGQGLNGAITFGVQNTLEAKVRSKSDSTGLKKIKLLERFSLNGSYNMAAEEFKLSTIRMAASSSMFDRLITLNYNATLDPYAFDEGLNRRINDYAIGKGQGLFRLTSQRFTAGTRLDANSFKSKDKKKDKKEEEDQTDPNQAAALGITEGDIDYYRLPGYVDFNVPWSLNLNYNLSYTKNGATDPVVRQSMDISGDMDLTQGWKVGFRTGYDFEAQDFTFTSFNFYRDLHCWTMSCSWVPFGFQQSYMLTIRVKSSILQDLKLERRRGVGDFQR
ncbi:putative LPS assembly protein LptD [Croceimicrobium sp.]|uniref:putative LPS assembly protein LptD n=1 Tax=Croceimicrobium sp. TaxID=2828340 RepID=UPI003BAB4A2A